MLIPMQLAIGGSRRSDFVLASSLPVAHHRDTQGAARLSHAEVTTMDKDPALHHGRRALLGAALGGAAVVAAQAVRPLDVRAATGEPVLLGKGATTGENEANAPTIVTNTTDGMASLVGAHAGAGTGLQGLSGTGPGVMGGSGDQTDVAAIQSESGVYGYANTSEMSAGVWGDSWSGVGVVGTADWGVYGVAGSAGVVGDAGAGGLGVMGYSGTDYAGWPSTLPAGVGVYALAGSTSQTALYVSGKVKLSRSGRKSIGSTKSSLKVTMAGVTTSSYIVATMQTNVTGVYVRSVVPGSGYFTIYLSKAPGKTVYVGFVVIN